MSGATTLLEGSIEGAEEERAQQVAMQRASPHQAVIHGAREEVRAAIEPALALDEIEEEHAGELQQGERVLVTGGGTGWHGTLEPLEAATELAKEPGAEGFDGEELGQARRRLERREVTEGRDAFQCRDRRRIGMVE